MGMPAGERREEAASAASSHWEGGQTPPQEPAPCKSAPPHAVADSVAPNGVGAHDPQDQHNCTIPNTGSSTPRHSSRAARDDKITHVAPPARPVNEAAPTEAVLTEEEAWAWYKAMEMPAGERREEAASAASSQW